MELYMLNAELTEAERRVIKELCDSIWDLLDKKQASVHVAITTLTTLLVETGVRDALDCQVPGTPDCWFVRYCEELAQVAKRRFTALSKQVKVQ
jgi:hypothetical protein